MLYDEFIEGTGCKATDYNYTIYKRLEIIYMNDDTVTKADIYEYGKKLVDNSLTPKQVEWNADIDRQIAELQEKIEYYKSEVQYNKASIDYWKDFDADMAKGFRRSLKFNREQLTYYRNLVRNLKTCKYTE